MNVARGVQSSLVFDSCCNQNEEESFVLVVMLFVLLEALLNDVVSEDPSLVVNDSRLVSVKSIPAKHVDSTRGGFRGG